MDDLRAYFKAITKKTISMCADCEARVGEHHRKVEHPQTNEAYRAYFGMESEYTDGHLNLTPEAWNQAVYTEGLGYLAHKEVATYG